mmetsp:Transcript_67118/g.187363  ORF Transcript_67118/g.187363 Transcript_67118/m.187363 type:complete len:101 (+) Transcript_67118:258-560(+)
MAACPREWDSAPSVVQNGSFHMKEPAMDMAHDKGECKPCAFFLYKPDGCRLRKACSFCHLCKKGDIRKRKRARKRFLKAQSQQDVEGDSLSGAIHSDSDP